MKEMRYYNTVAFVYRGTTLFIIQDGGGMGNTGVEVRHSPRQASVYTRNPQPKEFVRQLFCALPSLRRYAHYLPSVLHPQKTVIMLKLKRTPISYGHRLDYIERCYNTVIVLLYSNYYNTPTALRRL